MRGQAVGFSKGYALEKAAARKYADLCRSHPAAFEAIANAAGENFFDAGSVISTDGVDGIHFTADTNRELGAAVAAQVELLLE